MTLVDANVLLDVVTDDPVWVVWSLTRSQKPRSMSATPRFVRFSTIEEFDETLADAAIGIVPIPRAALFLAGKAFLRCRKADGARAGVLSDFFIGAHAAVKGWPLLTRDARRYRTYFPGITVITPDR